MANSEALRAPEAAYDAAQRIRDALASLKISEMRDPQLGRVLDLSQQLVGAMQAFFASLDRSVHEEFRYIATYIVRAREEIAALRPNDIREERIPSAGAELEAIIRHTEDATHSIMESAEAIMAADPNRADYADVVTDHVTNIFQACSFQDITGQRVRKVVETLKHIEERVARFAEVMGVADAPSAESEAEARKRALLLNGPALDGPETPQDAIDKLFDQSEIDKLFD